MILILLLLTACTNRSVDTENENVQQDTDNVQQDIEQQQDDPYDILVEQKNAELELEPLELTAYVQEVGLELKNPSYRKFAVNQSMTIEGEVKVTDELKEDFVWIKISYGGDAIASQSTEYYTPIKDGIFTQTITLFNGEGEYHVTVLLPSKDRSNYYYDAVKFTTINVNPTINRDITYSPFAQIANLVIQEPTGGYVKGNEVFTLQGNIDMPENYDQIMIELHKDGKTWENMIPVKDGKFTSDIPLFYGKGIHHLKVLVPDSEKNNYYLEGSTLFIENESERVTEPIEYYTVYNERGVHLDSPSFGGVETELTYRVKGTIDPNAPFAKETTHLYITTKKDGEEALDVIPVQDYQFDDTFYLRFGPGKYEILVSVPEIKEKNSDYFKFFGAAKFTVYNTSTEDKRDLLPSRGIQSDSTEIVALAKQLTQLTKTDKEIAKAIYEYTAKTISYDVAKFRNDEFSWDDSALKVLDLKEGVCQDYSYLAIALLRASNLEARYVTGQAGVGFSRDRHAWVEVKVDGEWLTMDPTWAAGYVDKDTFVAKYTEEYFDPDQTTFAKTHLRTKVVY